VKIRKSVLLWSPEVEVSSQWLLYQAQSKMKRFDQSYTEGGGDSITDS
jgi:hypothetical protein